MEEAELSKPEALESESAVKSSADIKAQEEAVREATNKVQNAADQAAVDNVKAEQQKLNNAGANATVEVMRDGGETNVNTTDINNFNDRLGPSTRSGTLGSNSATIRDMQTTTDPSITRAREAYNKSLNSAGKILNERFSKSLESKNPELKAGYDKITSDGKAIADKIKTELDKPNPDPKVLDDLENQLNAKQKELEEHVKKADKIMTELDAKETMGAKDYLKYMYFLGLLGGVLGTYFTCKALTGCYIFYGDLVDKLDGCSDYYNTDIDHQIQCRCGKSVDSPVPVTLQMCNSFDSSECTAPYCLGICSSATYTPKPLICEFPTAKGVGGRPLQCSTSVTGDNTIFYGYRQVTPLTLLSNAVNAIANAPSYAEDFMKTIFMYILYGIGGMFLLGILLLFLKYVFSKFTSSNSENKEGSNDQHPVVVATPAPVAVPTPAPVAALTDNHVLH